MKPAETVSRSPLDKPLGELTEEDISQLTREDCRRYLKEKGMRRPSWNKSQAIQQVISLKTLLETRPESGDAGIRQKASANPEPEVPPHVESVSGTESGSDRSKDPQQSAASGDVSSHLPAAGSGPFPVESPGISPRAATEGSPVGQMTIFYDGKVNVYEGVPPDKARLIMQLAANPSSCPPYEAPPAVVGYQGAARPFAGRLPSEAVRTVGQPASPQPSQQQMGKMPQLYRETTDDRKMSREFDCEGPTNRQASLQRYLEKRKDRGRFKNKRKTGASSSSSLEIYVNQQLKGTQTSNGQSSRSGTCSPTQPRPPHTPTRCSSVENQVKNICLSVDLNDDGKVG